MVCFHDIGNPKHLIPNQLLVSYLLEFYYGKYRISIHVLQVIVYLLTLMTRAYGVPFVQKIIGNGMYDRSRDICIHHMIYLYRSLDLCIDHSMYV